MAMKLKNIKEDEDKYLKSLFSSLDRNNNGLISIHEIRYIVRNSNENISTSNFTRHQEDDWTVITLIN